MAFLELKGIDKSFQSGPNRLEILRQFDLSVEAGELVAIVGMSGSGKTTLLNLIAGLDSVDAGTIHLDGRDLTAIKSTEWDEVRQRDIGMIFQFNQLLPEFTALENVMMPALLVSQDEETAERKARDLLDRLALSDRLDHRPARLSGGEQQRVAIARALINRPRLLLADEPTGSLDAETGARVFGLLSELQQDFGVTCLVVTHNPELARLCARIHSIHGRSQAP